MCSKSHLVVFHESRITWRGIFRQFVNTIGKHARDESQDESLVRNLDNGGLRRRDIHAQEVIIRHNLDVEFLGQSLIESITLASIGIKGVAVIDMTESVVQLTTGEVVSTLLAAADNRS